MRVTWNAQEKTMKRSYYDVLQVSPKALPEIIDAAYKNLKPPLSEAASNGAVEARNELLFLEEAYDVLFSQEKRAAYDLSLVPSSVAANYQHSSGTTYSYESESTVLGWWQDFMTARIFLWSVCFAALFLVYKFIWQQGQQQIIAHQVESRAVKATGDAGNEDYQAKNEHVLIQGVVQNQERLVELSHDIAAQEAERRRVELEYNANARSQQMEMQRQQIEAQRQQQKWVREQYEKNKQRPQVQVLDDGPKPPPPASTADASERRFIRKDMSEGEVLVKIGKPDTESIDSGGGAYIVVKRWVYFPAKRDEQTLTTITLSNGKVVEVDRQVSRGGY